MDDLNGLDYIFLPIAFLTEFNIISWPILYGIVLWLFFRSITKSTRAFKTSLMMWRCLIGVACLALSCLTALAIFSPKGPDYYRVVLGALASIPLIFPAVLGYFVRPKRASGVQGGERK